MSNQDNRPNCDGSPTHRTEPGSSNGLKRSTIPSTRNPGASPQTEARLAGLSALDESTPSRPRPSGAMTFLRNDLLTEESSKQRGWLENLLPRPVKTTSGQMPSQPDQGLVASGEMAIGHPSTSERPSSTTRVPDGLLAPLRPSSTENPGRAARRSDRRGEEPPGRRLARGLDPLGSDDHRRRLDSPRWLSCGGMRPGRACSGS